MGEVGFKRIGGIDALYFYSSWLKQLTVHLMVGLSEADNFLCFACCGSKNTCKNLIES